MGRFVCIVSVLLYSACAPVWNTRSADYTNGVYDPELLFYKKEKVEPLEEIGEEDLAGGNFIHPLHLRSGYIPSYDYSSAFHRGEVHSQSDIYFPYTNFPEWYHYGYDSWATGYFTPWHYRVGYYGMNHVWFVPIVWGSYYYHPYYWQDYFHAEALLPVEIRHSRGPFQHGVLPRSYRSRGDLQRRVEWDEMMWQRFNRSGGTNNSSHYGDRSYRSSRFDNPSFRSSSPPPTYRINSLPNGSSSGGSSNNSSSYQGSSGSRHRGGSYRSRR